MAGERDFWDYMGSVTAAFYPLLNLPAANAPTYITRSSDDNAKALSSLGTGQGGATENRTQEVAAVYDPNPAAVMSVFYEQAHAIQAANMTPIR